jgi:flagellar biosynthesis/type III secretory pathway chaperone
VKNPGRDRAIVTAACLPDADLDRLLEVVRELTDLMQRENEFLRSGMPAALSALTDRKEQLTLCLQELTRGSAGVSVADDDEALALKRHLAASGTALSALTRENMCLLEGAMSASRRRIESVMQAIRAHEGFATGHGKGATDFRISTVKFEV